jgi:hypothetical protein
MKVVLCTGNVIQNATRHPKVPNFGPVRRVGPRVSQQVALAEVSCILCLISLAQEAAAVNGPQICMWGPALEGHHGLEKGRAMLSHWNFLRPALLKALFTVRFEYRYLSTESHTSAEIRNLSCPRSSLV